EAARLYLTAIEYYQGNDKNKLIELYELYAYECYLTNKHKDAIIYTQKALNLWKEKNETEKIGNCMWFLSRLWWYDGNQKKSESFGVQAIEILDTQPSSKAKAMAYNNMAQLRSSLDQTAECIIWGQKAIAIAREFDDKDTLAHALISMGATTMMNPATMENGVDSLRQGLQIAFENSFHEHGARVYMILSANWISLKEYEPAQKELDEGILYCEERDLDSHKLYMLSSKARLCLETGNWDEAYAIATTLLKSEDLLPVTRMGALNALATIKMRRGEQDAIVLLYEAKAMAFETTELQRIIPAFLALLEYEWLTGKSCFETEALSTALNMMVQLERFSKKSRLYFWLRKTGKDQLLPNGAYDNDTENYTNDILKDVTLWEQWHCPYEQALALFEGSDADKKKALSMIQALGAGAVYEKMKLEMRSSGIKSIPRGIRKSTRANAAHLTARELDVLRSLKEGLQNKEIADKLFISAKTVDHHISSILLKLGVNSRMKAVQEAIHKEIIG
ncbi:MAG: helix-turn-helix domain-containing protein, partial [Mucilaginibacter sp.]